MRERPLREKKPKKRIEENAEARSAAVSQFSAPPGDKAFQDGWRECIDAFAIHAPNKRFVGKILDEQCVQLEDACLRAPTRENYARYEGYRAALKELRRVKRVR